MLISCGGTRGTKTNMHYVKEIEGYTNYSSKQSVDKVTLKEVVVMVSVLTFLLVVSLVTPK